MPASSSPVARVLKSCRGALFGVGLISGVINLLMLTGAVFMMQVYDRVLTSHSVATLVSLAALAIAAYLFLGVLDIVRGRVLSLVGASLDREIGPRVYSAVLDLPLRLQRRDHEAMQPFRNLENLRNFFSGPGPSALFDLPWVPIYLVIVGLLHPWLGGVALIGAILLLILTATTELFARRPLEGALHSQSVQNQLADEAQANSEAVRAMGMADGLSRRWMGVHDGQVRAQKQAAFVVGGFASLARMFRMILQSSVLGLGAYLAVIGEISAGAIIAASVLAARALAPVDMAIASWRGFVGARDGYKGLQRMFLTVGEEQSLFALPRPEKSLTVERISVAAPGTSKPILHRIAFGMEAGSALAVIGPSASGKTSLARALVGVWPVRMGRVTLDGASIDQWSPDELGRAIGYLPQDVQLFDGTVAENISRFYCDAESERVIKAAMSAGIHADILGFADGYDTLIGAKGAHHSAGQRQRLGLARALFGDPFLVVLDEPNANLDWDGEQAVAKAVREVRGRGGLVVVVAHRPSVLAAVDSVLVLKDGAMVAIGPRNEVLANVLRNAPSVNGSHEPERDDVRADVANVLADIGRTP